MFITNYNANKYECGIYSLKGLLNQMSAMMEGSAVDVRGFLKGATQCELRGDIPPAVIYPSKEISLGGNEEFVNDNGVYFKSF